jgi:class 3 adenylate cyclase
MGGFLGRLLAIGAEPDDDEDTRLRKFLLVVAALVITPLAAVWGVIYWIVGAPAAAAIPWLYVAISVGSVAIFRSTRNYDWFAMSQFIPFMTLPFVLMWTLGGFVLGSVVAIWASLGPLTALLLGHRRAAVLLGGEYAVLMVASAILPASPAPPSLPTWLQVGFIPVNLTLTPVVAWLLVRLFAGGREGVLTTVRRVVGRYFSPDLAEHLLADPRRAELGGEIAIVTILFADLGSYSTYAEKRAPAEVVAMLNEYFGIALPAIHEFGGVPVQLAGDAVMAVFGAPKPEPDHASRACSAALAILERTEPLAAGPRAGPRFHIGVNSGPALVGNLGSEEYRNFTAIGDTTNLAARLQGIAKPGEVVIGPTTATDLHDRFVLTALGPVQVKGRVEPTEVFALHSA